MAMALAPAAGALTYLVVNAVGLLWPSGESGVIYFNDGKERFSIDSVQRCYTFTADWSKPLESANWENFPDVKGQVAFFEAGNCKETPVVTSISPSAKTDFKGTRIYHKTVSSIIIWAYSVYPVNGLVHATKKETTLLEATTNTSESNATVGYYPIDDNSSWEDANSSWAEVDEVGDDGT
ncbi:hypothetical protein BBJ28_00019596 [Nothophytophthora sp. Chile5]|nr:hypothetical protein BBJ28_00019596 [Nothophytophthora sp. Chile5]